MRDGLCAAIGFLRNWCDLDGRISGHQTLENLKFGALQGGAFLSASMKHWEIIADNLSKAGWSWGYVSAIDSSGRTIWIADARGAVRRSAEE